MSVFKLQSPSKIIFAFLLQFSISFLKTNLSVQGSHFDHKCRFQISDARRAAEQTSNGHSSKANSYPSASNMFLPKKIADIFEVELVKASKSNRAPATVSVNPIKRSFLNFFRDKSVKLVCMVSMPFVLFWGCGAIFHVQLDYLVKVIHTVVYYWILFK